MKVNESKILYVVITILVGVLAFTVGSFHRDEQLLKTYDVLDLRNTQIINTRNYLIRLNIDNKIKTDLNSIGWELPLTEVVAPQEEK